MTRFANAPRGPYRERTAGARARTRSSAAVAGGPVRRTERRSAPPRRTPWPTEPARPRLLRFYALRQAEVDAGFSARLQRLEAEFAEFPGLRRELVGAALDFGAIDDRMRAFENVRRVVDRSAAFRYEVRTHRRMLAELRQQAAAISARLTQLQRETAPVRAAFEGMRDEVEALRAGYDRLAARAGAAEASIAGTADRLTQLTSDAQDHDSAIAHAEADIEQVRSATARDLAQRSTELRAVVEEVERRLGSTADRLGALIASRAQASDLALEALRTAVAANHDALRTGFEDRIERAQRTAATLRTAFELFQHEVAAERARALADAAERAGASEQQARLEQQAVEQHARLDAQDERVAGIQRRLGDIAGALEAMRRAAKADQTASAERLQETVGAIRAELATVRGPELAAIQQRLEGLAAEFERLCGRLHATPYMSAPVEAWPDLRRSTADDFDYVGFEDVFRGPETFIRERLRAYVALVEGCGPVLELGSGRGEFLGLMREHGIEASGVDLNADAVARARAKGLAGVVLGDANEYLAGLAESSVGAIFSAQFVEHLTFAQLLRCLELARTRLVPGGLVVAETPNPNSIEAWKTCYVDLSHQRPLFPEVFVFLCRSMGFSDVRVFYPNGGGFAEEAPTEQHEYAIVARAPTRARSRTAAPASSPNAPRRRRKARPRE